MSSESFTALVLAAGKGARMQREGGKVMAPLAGKPLLLHVLENLYEAGCRSCILVVGHCREEVESFARKESPIENMTFVLQKEQLGTGHALLSAEGALCEYKGSFLVTAGDMPLLSSHSFRALLQEHSRKKNVLTVLSAKMEEPFGYGRVCRDVQGREIEKIVEEKDASFEERKIQEVNTGSYALESPRVFSLLKEVGSENAQGEYYLPDLVSIISRKKNYALSALCLQDSFEARGVNTLSELEAMEELLRHKKNGAPLSGKASNKMSGLLAAK